MAHKPIQKAFAMHGHVTSVRFVQTQGARPTTMAYVEFERLEDAVRAKASVRVFLLDTLTRHFVDTTFC